MTLLDKLRHRFWHADGTLSIWRDEYGEIRRAIAIAQAVDELGNHKKLELRGVALELMVRANELLESK